MEPALDELRSKFNQTSGYQDVELLVDLRTQVMRLVSDTLLEMRKFTEKTAAKPTKLTMEEIRNSAIKRGRRPTMADHMQLSKTVSKLDKPDSTDGEEDEVLDDEKSLKSKMLLYLEAQLAAVEIGLVM